MHVAKHHVELSLGSSIFQEDLPKLMLITALYNYKKIHSFL